MCSCSTDPIAWDQSNEAGRRRRCGTNVSVLFGAFDRHNLGDLLFAHFPPAFSRSKAPVIAGLVAVDFAADAVATWFLLCRTCFSRNSGDPLLFAHAGGVCPPAIAGLRGSRRSNRGRRNRQSRNSIETRRHATPGSIPDPVSGLPCRTSSTSRACSRIARDFPCGRRGRPVGFGGCASTACVRGLVRGRQRYRTGFGNARDNCRARHTELARSGCRWLG